MPQQRIDKRLVIRQSHDTLTGHMHLLLQSRVFLPRLMLRLQHNDENVLCLVDEEGHRVGEVADAPVEL